MTPAERDQAPAAAPSAGPIDPLRRQRLDVLRQRAQAILAQSKANPDAAAVPAPDVLHLLEDLRTYQVELELQNDELRLAQQDLALTQRRYQTLFAQLPLPALVIDNRGAIDEMNDRARVWLGASGAGADDRRFWHRLKGDERTRLFAALRDLPTGASDVLRGYTLADTRPGASWDLHLFGLSIDYKLDRRVLVLLVDQSAAKAREEEQRFYSSLIDAADSLIYAVDPRGSMLLANQALLNVLGRSREQVVGHRRSDFLPLRDALAHEAADAQVVAEATPVTFEETVHGSDPDPRYYVTRKFALTDLEGQMYAVGGISTEVTSLKASERLARLSEMVFQHAHEAIIITDPQAVIQRVNPAFTRLSGFSAEALVGQHTRALKSGRQSPAFYQAMWAALASQGTWRGEFCNRRADGGYYTVLTQIVAVHDAQGVLTHYIATQVDVSALHELNERLLRQATYDALTGLPNRTLLVDRLQQLLTSAERNQQQFAVVFVDLDHFKEVNDTLGHDKGDGLLRAIAQRLQARVRAQDTVARLGGDEFVVLLPSTDRSGAQALAQQMLDGLSQPVAVGAHTLQPRASVGLAFYPQDGNSADLLLRHADIAMYASKAEGRNRVTAFANDMARVNDELFIIHTQLDQAITAGELRLHYQPQVDLRSGALVGLEALVRWQRPGGGLVPPGEFVPIAEKTGLLTKLDAWVMHEALRQLGVWAAAGLWQPHWRLAINQNVADLARDDLSAQLRRCLREHALQPAWVELEITEDTLMRHTEVQRQRLQALRAEGITLAIDDFGTGYSSLSYLRQLPVNLLKVDQQFVRGMLTTPADRVLVRTIITMARQLGYQVLAEGVELAQQQTMLLEMGCEWAQGYLFGRPMDAAALEATFLQKKAFSPGI